MTEDDTRPEGDISPTGGQERSRSGRGQGRVKDAAQDGRLKRNKELGISKGARSERDGATRGGQGRVKDPSRDGRLRENRDNP